MLRDAHVLAPVLRPLARAQDAVARLEATLEATSPDTQQGLRTRVSLTEASGWLAHRHAAPVHPRDLALREASLTGSYTLAALIGRAAQEIPHSSPADGLPVLEHMPQDWAVTQALHYARLWRRLAATATWRRPLRRPAALGEALAQLGASGLDVDALAAWTGALRRGGRDTPGLITAGELMDGGLLGQGRGEPLDLACSFVTACLWRHLGFGTPVALPFWSAPLSRLDALARAAGDAVFVPAYLDST